MLKITMIRMVMTMIKDDAIDDDNIHYMYLSMISASY